MRKGGGEEESYTSSRIMQSIYLAIIADLTHLIYAQGNRILDITLLKPLFYPG